MPLQGSFGYKIGRKIRLMNVQLDADLLWQICVREIYVLMKHYKTVEALREAFENLLEAKGKPKAEAIEKCKKYTDLSLLEIVDIPNKTDKVDNLDKSDKFTIDWNYLTRFCQHSFINMLESGYILNNGKEEGLVFILDFNTNSVIFYTKEHNKKIVEHEKATIEEIMEFDDMPTKTFTEIITEMTERYTNCYTNLEKVNREIKKIEEIVNKAKQISDHNIIDKAQKLWDDMDLERKKLKIQYRYFYHRLDTLNLIDHTDK